MEYNHYSSLIVKNYNTIMCVLHNSNGGILMKKRTKIISVVLASMLLAAAVPTALVQASTDDYSWEDYSPATEDEAESVPNVTSIEITKAPDKVFTTPLSLPVKGSEDELANSVSYNMQGAELTVYRENGDKYTYTFEEPRGADYVPPEYGGTFCTEYANMFMSDNDYNQIKVIDLGNYKVSVTLIDKIAEKEFTTEFTANHSGASSEDNPATPGEVINPSNPVPASSENGSSSTSDTPSNNNSSASNTNNGAVATGNTAVSVTLLSVLMIAAGILAVVGRKKQLF